MLFRHTQSRKWLIEAKCTFLESMICQEQLYGASASAAHRAAL
jgi:hypothetical protein